MNVEDSGGLWGAETQLGGCVGIVAENAEEDVLSGGFSFKEGEDAGAVARACTHCYRGVHIRHGAVFGVDGLSWEEFDLQDLVVVAVAFVVVGSGRHGVLLQQADDVGHDEIEGGGDDD